MLQSALKSDTTYIHCCTLSTIPDGIIRDTGGTFRSPATVEEPLMGYGNPPTQKAIDSGIRPSLSVDVETSGPNDFFTARCAPCSHCRRMRSGRAGCRDKNPPKFLTIREVLEFATVARAERKAQGLRRMTRLPVRRRTSSCLWTRLNVMPLNNAVGAVVTSMGPQNIDTVLIAGKIMKREASSSSGRGNRPARQRAQARNYKAATCRTSASAPSICKAGNRPRRSGGARLCRRMGGMASSFTSRPVPCRLPYRGSGG